LREHTPLAADYKGPGAGRQTAERTPERRLLVASGDYNNWLRWG